MGLAVAFWLCPGCNGRAAAVPGTEAEESRPMAEACKQWKENQPC